MTEEQIAGSSGHATRTGPWAHVSPQAQSCPTGQRVSSSATGITAGVSKMAKPKPIASAHLAAITLGYAEESLFCLKKNNPLRRTCILISHDSTFERFILLCILCNCVTLGMGSNRLGFDETTMGIALNAFEYVWVAIFTIEAILKIVSMGFVLERGTYLRDGWNVIDFLVVVLGFVDVFISGNLTALRTVRVLRPLRAVTRIQGIKVLVATMLASIPMLIDVMLLCAFTFFVWGLVAVQLFAGVLRNRCGAPDFNTSHVQPLEDGQLAVLGVRYTVPDDAVGETCSGPLASDTLWLQQNGAPVPLPGTRGNGLRCPADSYCTSYGNPNYGMTSFDNILWSWLTIFQCITLESWSDVMYYTSDAVTWWVWPLFVVLVFFGAFYIVSLALAVLFVRFCDESGEEGTESGEKQQTGSVVTLESGSADGGDGDFAGGALALRLPGSALGSAPPLGSGSQPRLEKSTTMGLPEAEVDRLSPIRRFAYRMTVSKALRYTTIVIIIVNTAVLCINWYGMPSEVDRITNYINYALTLFFMLELMIGLTGLGLKKFFNNGMNIFDAIVVVVSVAEFILDVLPAVSGLGPLSVLRMLRLLRIFRLARNWRELYSIIRAIFCSISSKMYLLLLLLLFMFIAALMGMQLFGYKFMFCDYVEGAKPICPLGLRVWGQCPDHFYCYLPCEPEQYGEWVEAPGSFYNGRAYCEQFCGSEGTAVAADANATAGALQAAGGCEYLAMVGKSQVPRAHFDNVYWGMYTVFQVFTGENWNNVMYDSMRTTSVWSAFYLIAVLLIGNYLVFNLFIAIVLDNFTDPLQGYGPSAGHHEAPRDPFVAALHTLPHSLSPVSFDDGDKEPADEDSAAGESNRVKRSSQSRSDSVFRLSESDVDIDTDDDMALGCDNFIPMRTDISAVIAANASGVEAARLQEQRVHGKAGPSCSGITAACGASEMPSNGPSWWSSSSRPPSSGRRLAQDVNDSLQRSTVEAGRESSAMPAKGVGRKVLPVGDDGKPLEAAPTHSAVGGNTAIAGAQGYPTSSEKPSGPLSGAVSLSDVAPAMQSQGLGSRQMSVSRRPKVVERMVSGVSSARSYTAGAGPGSVRISLAFRRLMGKAAATIRSLKEVRINEHLAPRIRGRSLLVLGSENWLRRRAARLVNHRHFETIILLFIAASAVCLALDEPSLEHDSKMAIAIRYMDYVFTGVFTLEAALKIIAYGFAFTGKYAYIRDGWNVLDFAIVLSGIAFLVMEASGVEQQEDIQTLRVLRTLRALRPLRAASRFEGLKLAVNTLFTALPAMANVVLVCLFFYLIFAILAVNLFKGKLYNCIDVDSGERLDPFYVLPPGQLLTAEWCRQGTVTVDRSVYHDKLNVTMPAYSISAAWIKPKAHFDNVLVALLTLLQVATLELWVDILFSTVDAVGVDQQPIWNHNPAIIFFFVAFIVICAFFILNLFVAVTLEKFTELQQAKTAAGIFMTDQQRDWVNLQKLLLRTSMQNRPARPHGPPWRVYLFDVVSSEPFGSFILITIVVNTMFMALVHADMSQTWLDCMSYTNLIFTCVFALEAVLKILAYHIRDYFGDSWNCFDFFVVVVSIVTVALDFSNTRHLSFMPVMRVLRVVRVMRLLRRAAGLQRLLVTLVHSLPSLANVGGIMLLFFGVFAVIGMNLFGDLKKGDALNRHANFDSFPAAMLVLTRMLTGESWNAIMQDCMATSDCVLVLSKTTSPATNTTLLAGSYYDPGDPLLEGVPAAHLQNQCPLSPVAAIIYFPTFIILCSVILLNLIIAIILENMIETDADEALPVPKSAIGQFVEAWCSLDNSATGFIHASQLPHLIASLPAPLGTCGTGTRSAVQALIFSVDIPVHKNDMVTFLETLHALTGRVAGTELPEMEEEWLIARFNKVLPGGGAVFPKYTAAHFYAALHVKAAIRGFLARHRMQRMAQEMSGDRQKPIEAEGTATKELSPR